MHQHVLPSVAGSYGDGTGLGRSGRCERPTRRYAEASQALPASVKQQVPAVAKDNANFVSTTQVKKAAQHAGKSQAQTAELVATYSDAQLTALGAALAFLALFALLSLAWVRRLPATPPDVATATGSDPRACAAQDCSRLPPAPCGPHALLASTTNHSEPRRRAQ